MLSSGEQRAIFHVIESDEPRDCCKPTPSFVTFVLRHHVVKVTSSVFQPAISKKRTILSLDQRIEVLRRVSEAHGVERLLPSQCGKTQMARTISKQTGQPSWPTFNTSVHVMYDTSAVTSLVVISVDSRAMCIIIGVPCLPTRHSDERPPVVYGHFCMVEGVP